FHQPPLICIVGYLSSGGTAGSNLLTGHGPRRKSPATAPTHVLQPDQAHSGLVHFPDAGHPWPGQQWQSNPRGKTITSSSEPKSSPPTGPAGDAHATLEPRDDQAPEFLT